MDARRRLMFSAAGGHGHLQPLLPLAEQAVRAGHQVLVTGAAALGAYVRARGLAFVASGPDLEPIHAPLVVHDLDKERRAIANYFVTRLGRARATEVLDLCRSWRPHLVVHDEVDFGSVIAAEVAAVPHVAVVVIGAGGFILPELISKPLGALASEFSLDGTDVVALLHRHLTLTPFPASFRDPSDPLPGRVIGYRTTQPPKTGPDPAGRTAYVTLGTIFNTESGDLLRTAALGAAASPAVQRVVVATGEHFDPARLGVLPDGVTVAKFVQQDVALGASDVVVSHAGSGTVLGALKQALPTVNLAMGADQLLNAARLQTLGLGVSLAADAATVGQIRDAVSTVVASEPMRRNLEAVREEIDALPDESKAVAALEDLTA